MAKSFKVKSIVSVTVPRIIFLEDWLFLHNFQDSYLQKGIRY